MKVAVRYSLIKQKLISINKHNLHTSGKNLNLVYGNYPCVLTYNNRNINLARFHKFNFFLHFLIQSQGSNPVTYTQTECSKTHFNKKLKPDNHKPTHLFYPWWYTVH